MPTQLTLEPGQYVVDVNCAPCDGQEISIPGQPMVRTMAIPEDGNYPYQPPAPEFPIGSSGDGVGFPSSYFQYPVYPGSGASAGYAPQPLPPLRGSYMNPGVSGSGIGSGSPTGYMPGGWRPPNYGYNAGSYTPPKPPPPSSTPPDYYQMYPERNFNNAIDWIANRDVTSAWAKYQMSAGEQGEIDTPEDWVYGYDRDAINDPRTNKSLFDSLMEMPFGVYSWDRTSTAATG